MTTLQEKTMTITFNIAGYDLEDINFTELHNDLMCDVTDRLAMFAVIGGFKSNITGKKDKK